MDKQLIVLSMPLNIGAGGLIRDYNVLPFLSRLIKREDYNIYIYTPYMITSYVLNSLTQITSDINSARELLFKLLKESQRKLGNDAVICEDIYSEMINDSVREIIRHTINVNNIVDKVKSFGYFYVHFWLKNERKYLNIFIRKYIDNNFSIYSTGEGFTNVYAITFLSKKLKTFRSSAIMLQLEPYSYANLSFRLSKRPMLSIANTQLHRAIRRLYINAMKKMFLSGILSVSPAPLIISRIYEEAGKYGVKIGIPTPANAVEKEIFNYATRNKDVLAIYFGRITRTKGMFELLNSWRIISNYVPEAKLLICGTFNSEFEKISS